MSEELPSEGGEDIPALFFSSWPIFNSRPSFNLFIALINLVQLVSFEIILIFYCVWEGVHERGKRSRNSP